MQDKIQPPPPPEIQIFEAKMPTNQWVKENIAQYYDLQSKIDFLNDVLNYVQQQESQTSSQAKAKPLSLKEVFIPLPEKGSGKDIANSSLYNSAQGYVKTQIEYLETSIAVCKRGNPKLTPDLDGMLATLRPMSKSFPHLSNQDMDVLNTANTEIYTYANQLPSSAQRTFWNVQLNMVRTLMTNNKQNINEFQSELNELKARVQMLTETEQLLLAFQNSLTSKSPSPQKMVEALAGLQTLANSSSQLNPSQQKSLNTFFQTLGQATTTQGKGLHEVFADTLIQTKISEFVQANPGASSDQLINGLTAFLKKSNLQNSSLPFMKKLGDSMEDLINKKGFPATAGYCGLQLATVQEGHVIPKEGFLGAMLAEYQLDPKSAEKLSGSAAKVQEQTSDEIQGNTAKVQGFTNTITTLKETQNNFGKAAAWTVGQSIKAGYTPRGMGASAPEAAGQGSLPWQFQHAILNKYMPQQEAYLEALAEMMAICNMGAEFGNILLNHMLDFSEAGNNYDFWNGLHASGPDFQGGVTQMQNKLNAERAQCSNDLNNATDAYNEIAQEIAKINQELNNKNLTPSQRQAYEKMRDSLESQESDLGVGIDQLKALKDILSQIHIYPPVGPGHSKSKYCMITGPKGWQTTLSDDETYVVNGNPASKPPGGLVNIQAAAQTFQQSYADQSQNMQMILQMRMTEIQQEWSIVSTAMQLLNQMYMTIAQAIFKG